MNTTRVNCGRGGLGNCEVLHLAAVFIFGGRDLAVGTPALYTSDCELSLLANVMIKTL